MPNKKVSSTPHPRDAQVAEMQARLAALESIVIRLDGYGMDDLAALSHDAK